MDTFFSQCIYYILNQSCMSILYCAFNIINNLLCFVIIRGIFLLVTRAFLPALKLQRTQPGMTALLVSPFRVLLLLLAAISPHCSTSQFVQ